MNIAMRKQWIALAVAFALAACLALVGCGGSSGASSSSSSADSSFSAEPTEASSSASSSSAAAEAAFGTKSATTVDILFTNQTGAPITALSATPTVTADSARNLMADSDQIAAGKSARVYLEPVGQETFTLTFLCNGVPYALHDVDFSRITEASICLEGDVAYLTTTIDGNAISTLQQEYDIVHPPVAEAPQQEAEQYYDQGGEGEAVYYDEPVAEEAPAQQEDSCVDDIVLN